MESSTITDKGQTTVPLKIRETLKVKPGQRLEWTPRPDGTAVVQSQPSALKLFGSLPSRRKFPGRAAERAAVARVLAGKAAQEDVP